MKIITLNQLRNFGSKQLRDSYNAEEAQKSICFNHDHIVALESVTEWATGMWPSQWLATRVHTVNGTWLVEGTPSQIKAKILCDDFAIE